MALRPLTHNQQSVLKAIRDCLEAGNKPVVTHICRDLGLEPSFYTTGMIDNPNFRLSIKRMLEQSIDLSTLIELKLRIVNEDVSTSTLAKLYSETCKRKDDSAELQFEDMIKDHRGTEDEDDKEVSMEDNKVIPIIKEKDATKPA